MPSVVRKKGDMLQKVLPYRNPAYLAFIRTLNCCECQYPAHLGNIEAHHVITGGMSTKGPDNLTVPLCSVAARGCHSKADKSKSSVAKYQPIAEAIFKAWSTRTGTRL